MPRQESQSKTVATDFTERVLESLKSLGAQGHRIIAAVSGGPDSTALLVALQTLRHKKKLELAAAHANHALRGAESDADEEFLRELCKRLHVPLVCRRLPVPLNAADRNEGIEAAARQLRQQFFADAAIELGARVVATAHTADDQAETVLHRIIRGTGLVGLAGIPVSRELCPRVRLIRPLLQFRRADVLAYLKAKRQRFREDRSNRDLTFTRNRIRHELLPYLAAHFNPEASAAICRLAGHAAEMQSVLAAEVDKLSRRAVVTRDSRRVVIRLSALRRVQRLVVREFIRQLWNDQQWPLREIGQLDLEKISDMLDGRVHAWDLPGGVRATRSGTRLSFARI